MVIGRLGVGSQPMASNKCHKGEKVVMKRFNVKGLCVDDVNEVKELRIAKFLLDNVNISVFAFNHDKGRCVLCDGFDVYYGDLLLC